MKTPTKSMATTFSSAKMPVAVSAKPKAKGKAAAAKKARSSEDSDEEQKMDINEENDDSDVILVEEVKQRKKVIKRVMGDVEEGDINGEISSILKTTKGDAHAQVKKKKVGGGKSKIKVVESDEEQQPEEEEIKLRSKAASPKKPTLTKKKIGRAHV